MAHLNGIALSAGAFLSLLLMLFSTWNLRGSYHSASFTQSPPHSRKKRGMDFNSTFLVGVGKADITGLVAEAFPTAPAVNPVVEVPFSGYGNSSQIGTGLRQRLYARSFIFANPGNTTNSFIYTVLDIQSGDTAVRHGILQGLANLGGGYAKYGEHNVAVCGTHSHSGPGAWMNYLLPQIATLGIDKQNYNAIVDGALLSIQRASEKLDASTISVGTIDIADGNANRSPYAYMANSAVERAKYDYDTDKTMTLLKIDRISDNKTTGILSFFSVHGTSLYNNNTLATGDNKGVAAYLFERSVRNDIRFSEHFVASFSQSSVGDSTPNVLGAFCEDTGLPCRFTDSTCNGRTENCRGRGPYFREDDNGAKSCFEMGRRQYAAASELYDQMARGAGTFLVGSSSIASFHVYHNMSGFQFTSPFDGRNLSTCYAALGYSFAGGTTDGPGAFDFSQNATAPATSNPFWKLVRDSLHAPGMVQSNCQAPKDIFLDVGAIDKPYAWAPDIVDIQALRLGQLLIMVSASEITTMSGRRWKAALANEAESILSITDPIVVLSSPANSYAHYVATEEEYSVQRYEGASTLFGPNQLASYVNLSLTYLPYLGCMEEVASLPPIAAGPSPPVTANYSLSFIPPVLYDSPVPGYLFGDVLSSSPTTEAYYPGDYFTVTFVGANPRNDLRLEKTYAAVEMKNGTDWVVVRDDADWNLVFEWERMDSLLGSSSVTVTWNIEDSYYRTGWSRGLQNSAYRFHYYGDSKDAFGVLSSFDSVGPEFNVHV